jgi:hypothetical protein
MSYPGSNYHKNKHPQKKKKLFFLGLLLLGMDNIIKQQ